MTSVVVEGGLTSLGAGGFMLVHTAEEDVLLDFFVEVPGRGGVERRAGLLPIVVPFCGAPPGFNNRAAPCGGSRNPPRVPGPPPRLWSGPAGGLGAPPPPPSPGGGGGQH